MLKNKISITSVTSYLKENSWVLKETKAELRWSTRRYIGSLLCSGVGHGFGSVLALT